MSKKETLCRIQTKVINNHTEILVQGDGRRGKKQCQKPCSQILPMLLITVFLKNEM